MKDSEIRHEVDGVALDNRSDTNQEEPKTKQIECQDSHSIDNSTRSSKRIRMSQRKFELLTAAIALKTRNDLEKKRHEAYTNAVGPLRMEFVDCTGADDESFNEEFEEFLDDEQKERERQERERVHHWHHSFDEKEKKKKKKAKKKLSKNVESSRHSSRSSLLNKHIRLAMIQTLHRQYVSFAKDLPVSNAGSIFLRVPEERLDLPRVLITGPQGTPYENGLFFFDFWAVDYPHSPPRVRFLTTGNGNVRFNPNLYQTGKVCLSLLGTWNGPGWVPGTSNLLQVLLSLQGLVLGTDQPFFNEPAYEMYKGDSFHKRDSESYNMDIRRETLRWGILDPLQKIVLQEERIDKRKRFLEKLKEQRQEEIYLRTMTAENEDGSVGSSSVATPSLAPSPNLESTKEKTSSAKGEKKLKWKSISSLWSGASQPPPSPPPSENGGERLLQASDMPPRATYEYPEFTSILIRHFSETADQIEERLVAWHELDPKGTEFYVRGIRKWQKRLKDLLDSREGLKDGSDEFETNDRAVKVGES